VLNKADIGGEAADTVRRACESQSLPIIAEIPYDPAVTAAMVATQTVIEMA
jgi:MinD superfamily P-loop ATPase